MNKIQSLTTAIGIVTLSIIGIKAQSNYHTGATGNLVFDNVAAITSNEEKDPADTYEFVETKIETQTSTEVTDAYFDWEEQRWVDVVIGHIVKTRTECQGKGGVQCKAGEIFDFIFANSEEE